MILFHSYSLTNDRNLHDTYQMNEFVIMTPQK